MICFEVWSQICGKKELLDKPVNWILKSLGGNNGWASREISWLSTRAAEMDSDWLRCFMWMAWLGPMVMKITWGTKRTGSEPGRCHVVETSLHSCYNVTRYWKGPVRVKDGENSWPKLPSFTEGIFWTLLPLNTQTPHYFSFTPLHHWPTETPKHNTEFVENDFCAMIELAHFFQIL